MKKYIIIKQLGHGAFGSVYLIHDENNNEYACKLEDIIKGKSSRLRMEFQIYHNLYKHGFINGIAKIYDFIKLKHHNLMILELLHENLEERFIKCNRKFSLITVFKIAIDMISLIQKLHSCNFIHRDVKPSNFAFKKNEDELMLIDFGLSKKYKNKNRHIKYNIMKGIIGTTRYISLNSHLNIEPSRRDDLESIAYILIYFIKGSLPWQGLKCKNQIKMIGEKKMSTSIQKLCCDTPICISQFLTYCRTLKFDEDPNYEYIKELINKNAKELNIVPKYEW